MQTLSLITKLCTNSITCFKENTGKRAGSFNCALNCRAVWFYQDPKWNIRCFLICKCKEKQNPGFISWQIKDNYWFDCYKNMFIQNNFFSRRKRGYFVITLSKLEHEQFFLLFVRFWHSFLRLWVSSCLCQNPSLISLISAFIISPTVPGCNVLMKFHCGFVVEWLLVWKITSIQDFLSQPKCKHWSIFCMFLFKNYFLLNS